MSDELRAAVAAGVAGSEAGYRSLLQSTVEVARAIFGAKASSVFLLDEETDELVFEAVAGEGAETLVGQRFPSSQGVAGWVLVTRQPLIIENVTEDPRFAKEVAESTGYVPEGLMAVPLLHEEQALGVLEVLDRPQRTQFSLVEMDLLGLFANHGGHCARPAAARAEGRGRSGVERGGRGDRRPARDHSRVAGGRATRLGLEAARRARGSAQNRRGRLLAALVTKLLRRDYSAFGRSLMFSAFGLSALGLSPR